MTDLYNTVFVDTLATLDDCFKSLSPVDASHIYQVAVDLEGIKLSRNGRVAILQIIAKDSTTVWILDITTLGRYAFDHVAPCGQSLKGLLECTHVIKLFYDVRNDSDALFTHYQVKLQNVFDVQLLDVAARRSNNLRVPWLNGLSRCIENNLGKPAAWLKIKEQGTRLFAPEKGGSYEVFEHRPIDPIILQYCAQDVTLLFQLKESLESKLGRFGSNWMQRVVSASSNRVMESMQPNYVPYGSHKAVAYPF